MILDPAPPPSRLDARLLAALFAALCAFVALTWAQWPTVTADGSRELYVPFQLLHGHVLYRDVVYLYGPLAPYVQMALLRAFGEHLAVLYVAAAVHLAAIMGLLYAAARHVLGPWRAAAVVGLFFTHFALGRDLAGYMWPYAFAASYGVLLGLALVVALMRHAATGRAGWLALGGVAAGLSCVTKLEYGAAAVALAGSYLAARLLLRARLDAPGPWWREAVALLAPLGLAGGAVAAAVLAAVDLPTVLESVWPTKLMAKWSSGGQWHGTPATWKEALRFFGVAFLPMLLVAGHGRLIAGDRRAWGVFLAVCAGLVVFAMGKDDRLTFIWEFGHRFWVGPSFVVLFLALGLAGRRVWRAVRAGEAIPPHVVAWCLVAGWGLLVAGRTLFRGMNEYTGYQAPIALVAWVALAAAWLPGRLGRTRATTPLLVALFLLAAGRNVADAAAAYGGPHRDVAGPFGLVRAEAAFGTPVEEARAFLAPHLARGERFVALPMEASLYLFTGQDNPVREDNLFFGYLTTPEEQAGFIRRLEAGRVGWVVLSNFGYGTKRFGRDYMEDLAAWLARDCREAAAFGTDRYRLTVFETPFGGGKARMSSGVTPPAATIRR